MSHSVIQPDPRFDLVLQRVVGVPRELVWLAWTTPESVKKWFSPAPWTTVACEIDLRPGGIFSTVMRSPQGQDISNVGCYLEIVPDERLVWTTALRPGYRPNVGPRAMAPAHSLFFTAVICLEAQGESTRYTATVIHGDEESSRRHEAMGFHQGWGKALDQLVDAIRATKRSQAQAGEDSWRP